MEICTACIELASIHVDKTKHYVQHFHTKALYISLGLAVKFNELKYMRMHAPLVGEYQK